MSNLPRHHYVAAAVVAVAYIAIQTFQWWAFATLPTPASPTEELLLGPHPLNIARAVLMLLSFFGLAYMYLVICASDIRKRPIAMVCAFLGFFVFCLLEIQLRAVELFHLYLALPEQFAAASDEVERGRILAVQSTFQSVQSALYFPLGLSQVIASLLVCVALRGERYDGWVRFAFGFNAVRLLLRMLDVYVIGPKYDALYSALYLPMVYVVFGATLVWLVLRAREGRVAGA